MINHQWRGRRGQARVGRAAWLALALLALALCVPTVATAQISAGEANRLMSAWQLSEARSVLDSVIQAQGDSPTIRFLEARYAFYTGEYDQALVDIDQALAGEDRPDWRQLRELIEGVRGVTHDYKRFVSPSGRFELYVEPGRDEVLVPYAIEALEQAYEVLGSELGHWPQDPVRVEVYPRTSVLADVSTLTHEDIRTSGTIALAQYNRLMITSPRAVLRGYSWVDTLVHEYIHYVVNQRTANRVPIWMHEGLAKYLERLWRGPEASMLDASSEHILRQRLEADDLIPFEAMHPSMAKLPSQQDAALAFAEVYTTMEYLHREIGEGAFSRLLDEINAGYDAQTAYARVLGTSWEHFEREDWPAYLAERPAPEFSEGEDPYEVELVFEDQAAKAGHELEQVEKPAARDHIKLGQMLQARDRFGAAVVQYEKASQIIGDRNPLLQTRLAQSLLASGEPRGALEALAVVRELYPSHLVTWLELGKGYLALEQYEQAREALREAARINPFHPEVHQNLARAYRALGLIDEAEEAERFQGLSS